MAAQGNRKKAGQAPISSHPVFPAIVALWFAALFGIGSMVLPVALLEKLVSVTGIASLVPAAAPPLGVTARILIALVAAGIGVALGVVLARRVAAAQGEAKPARKAPKLRAADIHPDAPAKRPISAREELGTETIDDPFEDDMAAPVAAPMPGRRRALSVTDESGRSEFLDGAPLPGGEYAPAMGEEPVDDALELDDLAAEEANATPEIPDVTMPLRNTEFRAQAEAHESVDAEEAAPEPEAPRPFERQEFAAPETVFETSEAAEDAAEEGPAMDQAGIEQDRPYGRTLDDIRSAEAPRAFAAPEAVTSPAPQAFAGAVSPVAETSAAVPQVDTATGPLAELSVAQLVDRFALALQAKAAADTQDHAALASTSAAKSEVTAPVETATDAPPFAEPAPPMFEEPAEAAPAPVAAEAPAPFAPPPFAPPADADRIVAERADQPAEAAQPQPWANAPEPFEDAEAEQDLTVPEALRPLDLREIALDEEEDDEDLPALSLQFEQKAKPFDRPAPDLHERPFAAPVAAETDAEEDGFEDEGGDGGYSSLLDMKRPLPTGQEFVRIDEDEDEAHEEDAAPEPVVVFPNQQDRRAAPAAQAQQPAMPAAPSVPDNAARPFDAPAASESGMGNGGFAPATPTNPPAQRADPGETEKALREALEKLQRMSGAA